MPNFTWIPFYHEAAGKVLEYENKQLELIALLDRIASTAPTVGQPTIKMISLTDADIEGRSIPLVEIDPFTFFAAFNRGGESNRKAICTVLKSEWRMGADVPADFEGVPFVNNMNSWFFPYATTRDPGDIPSLWQLARQAYGSTAEALDTTLFQRCLKIQQVKIAKLTMGLFWFSPNGFLALDKMMREYFEARSVTGNWKAIAAGDTAAYRELMAEVHQKLGYNHPQISHEAFIHVTSGGGSPTDVGAEPVEKDLPNYPLNQILYGPPGTGKTFTTIRQALNMIDGEVPDTSKGCVERFEALRRDGRIGFVTFHQSFSYEEFIEGLRPVLNGEGDTDGAARYIIRDGVFKQLALTALGATLAPRQPGRRTFQQLWTALVGRVEQDPNWRLPGLSSNSKYKLEFTAQGNVQADNETGKHTRPYHASLSKIETAFDALRDGETASHSVLMELFKVGSHTNLIGAIVEELKRMDKHSAGPTLEIEIPTSPVQEQWARSYLKGSNDYRPTKSAPRYVLIIDEINRGNISKILGELITLLETDKRLGAENELRVTLPYSNETFGVPGNLYLIGTMNTADKSLALLDIALRRRFSFEEMKPDFSICENLTEPMRQVLAELNRRLLHLLDREHRIGHAFFMEVPAGADGPQRFNQVFEKKIVPLLQEYFYNDWKSLRAVLGEKEGSKGRIVLTLDPLEGIRSRTPFAWWNDLDLPTPDFLAALTQNYFGQPQPATTPIPTANVEIEETE